LLTIANHRGPSTHFLGSVDLAYLTFKNTGMQNTELHEAAERAANGTYDPVARKRALDRMKATRDVLKKRLGEVDVIVPLLRESRDRQELS